MVFIKEHKKENLLLSTRKVSISQSIRPQGNFEERKLWRNCITVRFTYPDSTGLFSPPLLKSLLLRL
ncbi:hypothetical protein GOP47_0012518 [Adiantum capillus-veneris]|uniref:Uncharacterized protein n=1 Tax=Adiantum capillus-veneris TaxID=13818 RepID=A0A9D4ZFS5_ADICA|nr:hypothetical protein GOP47_0012518 [Adiantum capillus-veneris]